MKSLRDIWSVRFVNYVNEVQRYMRFVFTGHLAIVLVFTIGAGGYAYSNWLKEVPDTFPAALLTALILSVPLAFSAPATLLKPADAVFLLPLENQLGTYMGRALRYSFVAQLPVPLLLFIVAVPLLSATGTGSGIMFLFAAVVIVLLKWIYVETEYSFHRAKDGEDVWMDRLARYTIAFAALYGVLAEIPLLLIAAGVVGAFYNLYWKKQSRRKPFPYEHFIGMEQNRMMRFYRFANYFTDVPHLKGSVSRRSWAGAFMKSAVLGKTDPQRFLVSRTLIRTDDMFWLWVRLTALAVLGVVFIPFPAVSAIFTAALAFATAVQLVNALKMGDDFRMDMLFPVPERARTNAIVKTVRSAQWLQAALVLIAGLAAGGISLLPAGLGLLVIAVSEVTIRSSSKENNA